MASNRKILKLRYMATDALARQGIFSLQLPADATPAYQEEVSSVLVRAIHERLIPIFLQAVIDDDRLKVTELLDKNPELLLIKSPKGIEIQCQHAWLLIDVENEDGLSIASKRKQIKMIELLLPYYDKLEQTQDAIKAKLEALSAWKTYEMQKNAAGEDEIIIPQEYTAYAQSLADLFDNETSSNCFDGKFSEETESALSFLFNILLPKRAVKLDEYLDLELFLLALYRAANYKPATFQNMDQREEFCTRAIGLTQSVQSRETANIFLKALYYQVLNIKLKVSTDELELLKLQGNCPFYRSAPQFLDGHGFAYYYGIYGMRPARCDWPQLAEASRLFGKALLDKNNCFLEQRAAIVTKTKLI